MSRIIGTNIKINKNNFLLYIMLFPFFMPRGFREYSGLYHTIYVVLLGIASFLIFFLFTNSILRKNMRTGKAIILVCLYHLYMFGITLCIQSGISEGLQKIFIFPLLFVICVYQVKRNPHRFLDVLSNILIVDLFLNVFVFNQWLFPRYFTVDKHVAFIGHVQIVAQVGVISILVGYFIKNFYGENKGIFLIILAVINMIYSDTLVSYISLSILLVGSIAIKKTGIGKLFNHPYLFFWSVSFTSVLLIYEAIKLNGNYVWNGLDISLNGRMFIWSEGIQKLDGHWLFGYGVYGVLLKVFWTAWSSNKNGFNYAHNEILQLLLDGGVVMLALYTLLFAFCIKEMNKCPKCKEKRVVVMLLSIFMVISIVESITEYYYYFAFLAIISCLPIFMNNHISQSTDCQENQPNADIEQAVRTKTRTFWAV